MIIKSLLFCVLFYIIIYTTSFAQKTDLVIVTIFGFFPGNIEINIGDSIEWDLDSGSHSITSDSTSEPESWDVLINNSNKSFIKTFNTAGIFNYHCRLHPVETGVITVIDAVPVELTSFSAEYDNELVLIKWETATEANNQGFNIERQKEGGKWGKIAFVEGNGTSTYPHSYIYNDKDFLQSGNYFYRIKQIDFNGAFKYYNKVKVEIRRSDSYELMQNFPNPFNPTTNIKYVLPEKSFVEIAVYNVLGNKVAILVNEEKPAGFYETMFDGSQLSSGIYYLQMIAGDYKNIIKMILIR